MAGAVAFESRDLAPDPDMLVGLLDRAFQGLRQLGDGEFRGIVGNGDFGHRRRIMRQGGSGKVGVSRGTGVRRSFPAPPSIFHLGFSLVLGLPLICATTAPVNTRGCA